MPSPTAAAQRRDPGALVDLYDLDMTPIGGGVLRFTPGTLGASKVFWRGLAYEPFPVAVEGVERSGRGELPTPRVTLPATDLIVAAVISLNDLRLARLIRWQTFDRHLDGQPEASHTVHFPPQMFLVQRKIRHNTHQGVVEFELSSPLDQHGQKIPARVATHVCMWRYRYWNGQRFDNSKATCPYTGGAMFDTNDRPTSDPSKDRCSHHLSGCELRFGRFAPLPFGGFPGIARS
jgi:lambda family phage minor tail protein L